MKNYFPRLIPTPQLRRGHRGNQTTFLLCVTAFFILLVSSPCVPLAQDGEQVPSFLKQGSDLTISLSQEEEAWLKAHPDIQLVFPDGIEPSVIVNDDGTYNGIYLDFLDKLNIRLGTKIELHIDSTANIIQKAKAREVDGIIAIHPNHAERLGLSSTKGYMHAYPTVFAHSNTSFKSLDDFLGKKIAIMDKVYFTQSIVEKYGDRATILKVPTSLDGLQLVQNEEVDYFVGSSRNRYLVHKYHLTDISAKYTFFEYTTKFGMGIRADWPEFVSIVNKGISSFSDHELEDIVSKWTQLPTQEQEVTLTSEEQAWLTEHGPKVRVSLVNLPPLQFKQESEFTGYQVDILEAVLMRVGLQAVYTMDPFVNVFADLKEKKTEISLDFIRTEERRQVVLFSKKKFDIYMGIFARKERIDLNSVEALKNAVIASHPGYGLEPKLKRLLPDAVIVHAVDPQGMFRLVSSGKADVVIHGLASGEFMLQKNLINNVVSHGEFLAKGESRLQAAEFVVRKDLPHLMSIIDTTYASIEEAEKQAIWEKWFGKNASKVKTSSILFTDQERAWMAQKHTVHVSFWQHPPYSYLKNGKVVGLSVDLLNKVSEKSGVTFRFENRVDRFSDVLKGLQEHEGPDLVGAMMPTTDREKAILFTKPYINSPRFIFTRDSAPFVSSIENLFGKKVAVVKDSVVHRDLTKRFPDIDLLITNTNEEALRSVSSGAAFAFIGDLISTPAMINLFGLKNLKAACSSGLPDHQLSMGVRDDWPELWSIISKALEVIPEAEKAAVINRWSTVKIDHGIKPGDVLKLGLIVASIAICIISLFVFWNRSLARQVQERTADLLYQATLLENVSDAVVSIDLKFRIISWNKACEQIYGWKTEEVMGKVFAELTSIEYQNYTREEAFAQIKTQGSWRGEVLQYRKDKEKIYVQASISLVKNNTGEVIGYVGVTHDITEQKKNVEKIKKSEEYFSKVFYSQAIPMAILNTETGERIDFNDSYTDLTGYSREELQQNTLFSLTVGVDLKDQLRAVETLRKERQVSGYPMTIKTKSGKTKHLVGSAAMLEYGDGNMAISAWVDITKRILVEEELRVSEEKFFKVFQGSPNAVSISKLESGKFIEVNQSFERLFGFSHEEIIDKNALDVDIWKNPSDRDRLMKDYLKNRQLHVEGLELIRKTGETIITDVNFVVMEISGIDHSIAIISDITDRKQAEEKIQQYQTRLKALASQLTIAEEVERSRIAVELHDHVGQILTFSHIQVGRAQRFAEEKKLQGILEEISEQLLESIRYTKELVFDLSSPLLYELGLITAIADWLEEHVRRKNGINTELIGSYQELFLSKDLKSILFRNVRELLANVIKHAQASKVIVSLESNSSELNITVHDDGVGFHSDAERPAALSHSGFGLFSIRERLDDFGGSLAIISSPGKGCKVIMTIQI